MMLASIVLAAFAANLVCAAEPAPLTLESKIPLGQVMGRIDHLAYDPARQLLYVAELGNDTIAVVDIKGQRVVRTVSGFDGPQGIAYEPGTDAIYVANGGDGTVQIFSGSDFALLAKLVLGEDADNVRIDQESRRVYVGYGGGAIAIIDAMSRKLVGRIPLQGHPEGFQLDPEGDLIFVNVPDARQIALVSREKRKQVATWTTGRLRANYPLTLDSANRQAIAVFRQPARVQSYEMPTGREQAGVDGCSDADDVFVDARRRRAYVICGQGVVDTLEISAGKFSRIDRFATSEGARTGLWVPELDRLLVAIRSARGEPAAIWILRPL
jgi:YVTN family beta-propeller protein